MPDSPFPKPVVHPSNPFLAAIDGPGVELIGRKELLFRWEQLLEATAAGGRTAVALQGLRGMGKSLALKKLERMAERYGVAAAYVSLHAGDDERTVVRKISERFRWLFAEKNLPSLPRVSNLSSLMESVERTVKGSSPVHGIALLLDSFDELRDTSTLLRKLSDLLGKKSDAPGWLVVASGMHFAPTYRFELLRMESPRAEDVESFLAHSVTSAKLRWGEECLDTVLRDSGRNPLVFLTIARILYDRLPPDEQRLTKAHYLRHFNLILQSLSPLFDELYYRTSVQERKLLHALTDGAERNVSTLARSLHLPLNTVTTLALRLVRKGSLVRAERGKYRLFNPLYGKYVLSR